MLTLASIWLGLAVFSAILAYHLKISIALVEICVGVAAAAVADHLGMLQLLGSNEEWLKFLASSGSILLTFLAGAELEPDVIKTKIKEVTVVGFIGFLSPFLGCAAVAKYMLHWDTQASLLAGVALSTTSMAVVYAVMLETGFNKTEFGKGILGACFINDLGTVIALGLLFAPFTYKTVLFVVVTAVVLTLLPWMSRTLTRIYAYRTAAIRTKWVIFILFALGALALWSGSEAVLPAYIIGMVLARFSSEDTQWMRRIRTLTVGFLTPIYFLRAGTFVSMSALIAAPMIFVLLFVGKVISKIFGLYPFVAIDHEGGAVFRLGQVATRLPSAARYLSANSAGGDASSTDQASVMDSWHIIRQAAYLSGRELRALGITMNLAPVAEPLAPENRDFLQNRSFAADPSAVASAAAAFIQGMGEAGVVSVVKHFPASAAADPHHGRSVLTVDKKRLLTLASPFEALLKNYGSSTNLDSLYPDSLLKLPIQAGGVMVAHTMVPTVEPEVPASLSSQIMQDWVKESIGFSGIVLADDFTMKAITSTGISPEAAIIRSLMAGSDMVMVWPRDLRRFHRLLVEQAKSDTLFRTRLVDAASRIINIKLLRGLTEFPAEFNDEGYGCMRKATEQFLRERNLR